MTAPADLVLTNAAVHTLAEPDEVHEAVAVRDGRVVRVDSAYEVRFLEGADTRVIDLDGGVVLPGFVDAHTHLPMVGRSLVHADLSAAGSPAEAISLLRESADDGDAEGPILGYGYDESAWEEARYLTREDLNAVSAERPVVAFREDMHTASLNSVALSRFVGEMPDGDVRREGGEPTGVVVEEAVDVLYAAVEPDAEGMRRLIEAARDRAHELGVTGIHDMVRKSAAPAVYRDLDAEGALDLRVRINYWSDHLDSLVDLGERTNFGSDLVRTGAVKSFTDGSFGARTAKLSEPYRGTEEDGQWVVPSEELDELVARADGAGLQFTAHAIGDDAIEAVLDAYAESAGRRGRAPGTGTGSADARHRVEHAELLRDDLIERLADLGVVASVQPNFLKWAREGGLYEDRLGRERARETNRYRDLLDAGVPLAFGSDCMPMDPLFGVQQAVTAPDERQRLTVTEALRAYTSGAAYAGFDEHRLGTIEVGKRADLTVLARSPWEVDPSAIADVEVTHTVVDGRVVYEREN
ncbi:amidohydrolase [Halomarina pelagica]|uniref:amidohydrolase n=1 Tax=Halomarina pelagica TaxID=2961599 RepID=UPI0020C3F936|nr:amidohydrolase [Halomarina sp. BND7]